jgi:MFS family permease
MVIVQGGLLSPLVRLFGELLLLRLAIGALLLGLLSAIFVNTMSGMVGSFFLALTGATLCIPLLNTIVSFTTAQQYRGRMLGITSAASSWGRVIGPLLAGTNLALWGYQGAWLGSAIIVVIYLLWALMKKTRRVDAEEDVLRRV